MNEHLVHDLTHKLPGPVSEQVKAAWQLDEDELASLPIPLPGAPIGLLIERPPVVYEQMYRRALVVATKVCAIRSRRYREGVTVVHRRAAAHVTAEYGLWYVTGRAERVQLEWPRTKQDFVRTRGITENQLETALDLCRFKSWIHRYEKDEEKNRTRNVDDILYSKILEQEGVASNKVNPKLFDTWYRRHGHISPREGDKHLTVNVNGGTAEDQQALLERVQAALPHVKGAQGGEVQAVRPGGADSEGAHSAEREAAALEPESPEREPERLRDADRTE